MPSYIPIIVPLCKWTYILMNLLGLLFDDFANSPHTFIFQKNQKYKICQIYIAKTQVGIHMSLPSGCDPNWSKYLLQKHKLELIGTFEVIVVQIN
jgi:hypothetical protein